MARHPKTLARMDCRVDHLIAQFSACLNAFEALGFKPKSLASHQECITMRKRCESVADLLDNPRFFDELHQTLAAWGMNRNTARLVSPTAMQASFQAQTDRIAALEHRCLLGLSADRMPGIADDLWDIIEGIKVGTQATKIVAGTKALHHVLPHLLPPMDRRYTLRFFYHGACYDSAGERAGFAEMLPHFHRIATACRAEIEKRLNPQTWHTSPTKVIDNAIIGYVSRYLLP
jgi:hypothetical protein